MVWVRMSRGQFVNGRDVKASMVEYFYPLARGPWLKSFFLSSSSDRFPRGEYIGESLSKMKNSTCILYTPKLLLMVSRRTRRSGLIKRIRHKKCHDTITLRDTANIVMSLGEAIFPWLLTIDGH